MRKVTINVIALNILFVVGATIISTLLFLAVIRDESERIARIEQEQGIQTFWKLLGAKGKEFRISDGMLMAGDFVLNGNEELPDTIQSIFGGTATIFMGDTRVSTNLRGRDGTRALGTRLEGPAHDAIFRHGTPYRGEAIILGVPYFTAYDPIKNSRGEIIGALYVGARKNEFYSRYERYKINVIAASAIIATIFAVLAAVLLGNRKRHDEALQDNEAKYRTLFESSSEGILLLKDTIFDCNEQMCRLFGVSRDEIIGRSPAHFSPHIQPDGIPSADKARQQIDSALSGQSHAFPWQHQRRDGTLIDTEISLKPLTIQGHTVLQAVVRDVTERKEADARMAAIATALSEASGEGFLQSLVEHLATILRIDYALIAEFSGDNQERARTIACFGHGNHLAPIEYDLAGTPCAYPAKGSPCHYPEKVAQLFPDDRLLAEMGIESYLGVPLHDADGTIIGIMAIMDEKPLHTLGATESVFRIFAVRAAGEINRRRAENTLRLSEERYRAVFESTGTAMVIIEEDTTLALVNDEYVRMSGCSREELEGKKTCLDFVAPGFREMILTHHRNRRTSPDSAPSSYEFDYVTKTGEIRNIFTKVNMIPGTARSIASYMDITPLKRAERLMNGEKHVLELIGSDASLQTVLEVLCRLVEEQAPELRCSILLVDADGRHLRHGASPNLPEEYNRAIDGTRIGPDIGSCGTAAHTGSQIIASDIETDPRWAKYRRLPLSHGLRACWSTPVRGRNGILTGTFAVYSTTPREPSEPELQLLERFTHLTSIAIERKQSEESLRTIRLQQQAMLDNIPDIVWLKDTKSRLISVNAAFARACGTLPSLLAGKTDLDLWPAELANLYREDDARVMGSGKQIRTEEPLVDVNGTKTWIETIKMPVFDESGTVIGTTGIARDMTERIQAEEALRESETRFREIFEQNEDAIILLARESLDVIDANRAAETLIGRDKESLNWLGPWSFIVPDDYNSFIGSIPQSGDTTPFHLDRIGVVRCDGTRLIASIWGKVIRLRDTEVVYCSIRDITRRVRMEEEARIAQSRLIHTNKMASLGVLVSGIAHEINNPNTFIQGNAALMESFWRDTLPILDRHRTENGDFILGGLPFSEVERIVPRLLHGVKEGSRRISAIVNNLKDFAREDTSRACTPVNINGIVEDAKLILSYQIHRYTDHFRLELAENLPPALGKSQQIEQVVINLIMNALQSLQDKNAGITLSTGIDPAADHVTITIRDEGEGMSREVLERITEPFFSTRLERGGTGLGLSISAAIIREHNGTLRFESTPGRGTVAKVTLPLAYRTRRAEK